MDYLLSEQELLRRDALLQLRGFDIEPYPAASFEVSHYAKFIKENYTTEPTSFTQVSVAGRLMMQRIMGKASFAELQDSSGRIQLYLKGEEVGQDWYDQVFKKLLDLGDYIGVTGYVFITKMGEISIHVREIKLLSKTLKPLPIVKRDDEGNIYDGFTDPELRFRQRYVDLVVNPEVKDIFIKRSKMINSMRNYMQDHGYLEVETPVLQPLYGGATARPFKTHHNTLDMPLYLRIANELYLKRLIVGGFDGVFEFAKDFRNEGMSRFHNPEFTMMELYVAYKDCYWMMDFFEAMIENVCTAIHGKTEIPVGDNTICFARPWKRYTMYESIMEFTGIDISEMNEVQLKEACITLNIHTNNSMGKAKLIDELFGAYVEPKLIQPTFITDYPIEMSPLAKKHRSKPGLVERFEVICNSKEICNAFSELNDPLDQRERFEEQLKLGKQGDEEAMMLDEDFLRSLEYGMPPTAGIGIGIDRLCMILTNQTSIQEVIFFPQMRPEVK